MHASGEYFEIGLIEEGRIDHGFDLTLANLNQSNKLKAFNQIDALP